MLHSFEIKNFKIIKSKQFSLRNLNILMGLEWELGKSSLIQALLCLRQSKTLENGVLTLNNPEYVTLGKTKDVLYQYSKNEDLVINIRFSNGSYLQNRFDYKPEADYFRVKNFKDDFSGEDKRKDSVFRTESLFTENFQYLNANRFEPKQINPQNYTQVVGNKNIGNDGKCTRHISLKFTAMNQ